MNYILPQNNKAIQHFKSIGAILTPYTTTSTIVYYGGYDDITYDKDIILISGGIFDNMTSKKFHKYLKTNNLLLTQQSSK